MLNYNQPVRIFYANLLRHGVTLRVVDGVLKVGGDGREFLSPAYRDEIKRRAPQLIELLSPAVPEPLQSYMARLLRLDEMEAAIKIARQMEIETSEFPANGGWVLLLKMKEKVTP